MMAATQIQKAVRLWSSSLNFDQYFSDDEEKQIQYIVD